MERRITNYERFKGFHINQMIWTHISQIVCVILSWILPMILLYGFKLSVVREGIYWKLLSGNIMLFHDKRVHTNKFEFLLYMCEP
jgi:hypothetical protein